MSDGMKAKITVTTKATETIVEPTNGGIEGHGGLPKGDGGTGCVEGWGGL